ncbi:hypothetical protein CFC21_001620, partial [Triticum aestivum]
MSAAGLHKRN